MTSEEKFQHHKFLQIIADEDVRFIVPRDTSYGASWKKDGGKGVWANLNRKIDRMVNMMGQPEPNGFHVTCLQDLIDDANHNKDLNTKNLKYLYESYLAGDVFAFIEKDVSGADGTMLDQVRDLRRYLLLVEAEMMARGVVTLPVPAQTTESDRLVPRDADKFNTAPETPIRCFACSQPIVYPDHVWRHHTTNRLPYHFFCAPIGSLNDISNRVKTKQDMALDVPTAAPDDGAQHESLTPWVVNIQWLMDNMNPDSGTIWYHNHMSGGGVMVLKPHVCTRFAPPDCIKHLYWKIAPPDDITAIDNYMVKISACPPGARDQFPILAKELDTKEHSELPKWQRDVYKWSESDNKFKMPVFHDDWEWAVGGNS